MNSHPNSFNALDTLRAGDRSYAYFRLAALEERGIAISQLPFAENLAREPAAMRRRRSVTKDDIEALARYDGGIRGTRDCFFAGARSAAGFYRRAVRRRPCGDARGDGGDGRRSAKINPLQPVELVIDHSVQVDYFGSNGSLEKNTDLEFERNRERYAFLKWGQSALHGFRVVPPGTGIVHQVNIEYLARVVFGAGDAATRSPIRILPSGPIRTRRWSTVWASWRGVSAGSKPKRRCSASR